MAIKFPPFDPGSTPTLLDSEQAKKVKAFIEAWNNAKVIPAEKDSISVTDGNVLITYAGGDGGGIPDGYEEITVTLCVDGAPVDYNILAALA